MKFSGKYNICSTLPKKSRACYWPIWYLRVPNNLCILQIRISLKPNLEEVDVEVHWGVEGSGKVWETAKEN